FFIKMIFHQDFSASTNAIAPAIPRRFFSRAGCPTPNPRLLARFVKPNHVPEHGVEPQQIRKGEPLPAPMLRFLDVLPNQCPELLVRNGSEHGGEAVGGVLDQIPRLLLELVCPIRVCGVKLNLHLLPLCCGVYVTCT